MLRCAGVAVALIASLLGASAQTQIPPDSRLKSIAATKNIRIAFRVDATPFAFRDEKGQPTGYSIDLCQEITQSIAQQFGIKDLKVEWVPVTVQSRFAVISGGQADLECGSSSVSLGRMKEVDFSNFIFVESTAVVVPRASNIHSFGDMGGKKIAVVSGTTNEYAVREHIMHRHFDTAVVTVKDRDEGIALLEAGKVDAFANDRLLLLGAQVKDPEKFIVLADDLSIEAYAIALPRGDWALRLAVNTGLAHVLRSGEIINIYKKWFEPIGLQPGPLLGAIYTLGALAD
jgi:glutamate/aspartate transport system substrate-binding protein